MRKFAFSIVLVFMLLQLGCSVITERSSRAVTAAEHITQNYSELGLVLFEYSIVELKSLDLLIKDWERHNPDLELVSYEGQIRSFYLPLIFGVHQRTGIITATRDISRYHN